MRGERTLAGALRLWSLSLAAVMAAGALVTAFIAYGLLGVLGPRLERAIELTRVLREAHEAMLDQETGLRAYITTGEERFLEPYHDGVARVTDANAALSHVLGDDPDLDGAVLALRLAQQRWSDRWATPAAENGAVSRADELDRLLGEGKELFDRYREANALAVGVAIDARSDALSQQRLAIIGGLVGQVLLLLATYVITRRQRTFVRRELVEPVDELVEAMEAIEHGDLDIRPVPSGSHELQRLAVGLGDMTRSLQRDEAELRERAAETAEIAAQLGLVLDVARDLAGSLNVRYVCESIAEGAARVSGCDAAVVWGADDGADLEPLHDSRLPRGSESDVAPTGAVMTAARDARAAAASGELTLPLVMGGRVVGVLQLIGDDMDRGPVPAALETLTVHAAAALEAARLHEDARELSLIDALTRLNNRRRLETDLAAECERSARYGRPLGFIMLDLDRFKSLNDRFGHPAGDAVLSALAPLLLSAVRSSDSVYRYGGEELSVVVREGDLATATELAERLCALIRERLHAPDGSPITASFGVAAVPGDASTPVELIAAADRALYQAKAAGRDRVMTASSATPT